MYKSDNRHGESFLSAYGDGMADIDIKKLVEFHFSHGNKATVTWIKRRRH